MGHWAMAPSDLKRKWRWLGRRPLRTCLRLGAAVLGVAVSGWLLAKIWPEPDRIARGAPPNADNPRSLAPFPEEPVTVLIVGIDADRLGDTTNKAAPKGPANADALVLVRISADQPVQVLQMPTELAVRLPGGDQPTSLSSLWLKGGVSLVNDAIREVVGLPEGVPQRYVVMPRQALRSLVDKLGEVDVILGQSYKSEDSSQGYSVNLQAGRQRLNGAQAEQLARFRKDTLDDANRRTRQQLLIEALIEQIKAPGGIAVIPSLVKLLDSEVETNLSQSEQLSLAAAAIASPTPAQITQLPLAKRAGDQVLRQIRPGLAAPVWPQP